RDPELHEKLKSLEKQVINKTISPFAAASSLANDKFE
ncbi:MAG: hypothetical protein ACI8TS_001682, partial [Flavobacteriales bacterium]